jgi:hypothetical protein
MCLGAVHRQRAMGKGMSMSMGTNTMTRLPNNVVPLHGVILLGPINRLTDARDYLAERAARAQAEGMSAAAFEDALADELAAGLDAVDGGQFTGQGDDVEVSEAGGVWTICIGSACVPVLARMTAEAVIN